LEPGIYFNDKSIIIDDRYYGIGIRLENDILVLDDKSENLSLDI
jgi:Xaa-Pro aminopeptidase